MPFSKHIRRTQMKSGDAAVSEEAVKWRLLGSLSDSLVLLTVRWSVVAWYPSGDGYVYGRARLKSMRLTLAVSRQFRKCRTTRQLVAYEAPSQLQR